MSNLQRWWGKTWIVGFLAIIFIMLWSDIGSQQEEEFEPRPRSLVMDMFDHFQKKNVFITKESIVSIRVDDIRVEKPRKVGLIEQMIQRKKAFSVRAMATPKILLSKGSLLVGKTIRIEAEGETRQSAVSAARDAMNTVTQAIVTEATVRGLMAKGQ